MLTVKNFFLCLLIWILMFTASFAGAEIKIFEKDTIWKAAPNQVQEQAEGLAKIEAQRQAIEAAAAFLSSLDIVKKYKLEKDKVIQLAFGILKTKTLSEPTLSNEHGMLCVRIKTFIQIDTAIIDRQIETLMKDEGALKREEDALKKVCEIQEQLINVKSSEGERIADLNVQIMNIERKKNKLLISLEENALRKKGDLSLADVTRLGKEREIDDRVGRLLGEQEREKRSEAANMAAEKDLVRRIFLENEQRINDLSRRTRLSRESWSAIDDSLTLNQAVEEVKKLKAEIAAFRNRIDFQFRSHIANIKNIYTPQRYLMTDKMIPEPAPKDDFETMAEYNQRIAIYENQVKQAVGMEILEKLRKEEALKLAEAKGEYLFHQIRLLTPFVERLGVLQSCKFNLPEEGNMNVELGLPDAENNRFPVNLSFKDKSWSVWWNYTDRNSAREFYRTRSNLRAEGFFQIEEAVMPAPKLTLSRVMHSATKEFKEFTLEIPSIFSEIEYLAKLKKESEKKQEIVKESRKKEARLLARKEIARDGRFIVYDDGTVLDSKTNLMWAVKDNGDDINWHKAKSYCENYPASGYTDWRMPTQDELTGLYDGGKSYKVLQRHYNVHLTEMILLTASCLWASDTRNSESAYFDFMHGKLFWTGQSYSKGYRVLPVRAGK